MLARLLHRHYRGLKLLGLRGRGILGPVVLLVLQLRAWLLFGLKRLKQLHKLFTRNVQSYKCVDGMF